MGIFSAAATPEIQGFAIPVQASKLTRFTTLGMGMRLCQQTSRACRRHQRRQSLASDCSCPTSTSRTTSINEMAPEVDRAASSYLTALAGTHKPASLQRRLTAISKAHQAAGHPSPASTQHAAVSEIFKGIKRTVGPAQPGKEPLFTLESRKMIAALPGNLQGAPTSVSFRRCWETCGSESDNDATPVWAIRQLQQIHRGNTSDEAGTRKQDIREGLEAKEGDEDL
jgi:hypothetical protein